MEEFNKFAVALEDAPKYGHHNRILGFRGTTEEWNSFESGWYDNRAPLNSFKDRKKESQRHVKGEILVYSGSDNSGYLDWKCLYRNNKGVYFKKDNTVYYIKKAPLPDNMK